MGAFFYLYKRSIVNRMKRAIKKPVTIIWLLFILFYIVMVPYGLMEIARDMKIDSPNGMVIAMSFLAFMLIPANIIAYAKRKGLAFMPCDVHFAFPSPISPKLMLVYAHMKGLPVNLIIGVIGMIISGLIFGITPVQMVLFLLFATFMQNILEAGIMVIMYGSEKITEKVRKVAVYVAYGLIGFVLILGLYTIGTNGLSLESVQLFISSDVLKMVPFIGWYIAVLHLIILEPTVMTIIGSAAYLVAFVAIMVIAVRMKCTGQYYEDAMTFADDYAELRNKQKQGSAEITIGKKKAKLKQADVAYKGSGAKALFYRQLLEYKKQKFFVFDGQTMIAVAVAVLFVVATICGVDFEEATPFIIPGIIAYIVFIFANLNGKWHKELKYAYTYLIPDSSFKKLFYATLMQLLLAAMNGVIMIVPSGIALGYKPVIMILCIICYVALMANKLYSLVVTEFICGTALGLVARQFIHMLLMGVGIGAGALGAVLGFVMGGEVLAYVFMLLFTVLISLILMIISSLNFEKMESL